MKKKTKTTKKTKKTKKAKKTKYAYILVAFNNENPFVDIVIIRSHNEYTYKTMSGKFIEW